jgi:hypothetical protein
MELSVSVGRMEGISATLSDPRWEVFRCKTSRIPTDSLERKVACPGVKSRDSTAADYKRATRVFGHENEGKHREVFGRGPAQNKLGPLF